MQNTGNYSYVQQMILVNGNFKTIRVGEMCSVGRKIYQCIKRTRRYNTWVEEHDGTTSEYWVKIYESYKLRQK